MFAPILLSLAILASGRPSPANLDAFADRTYEWSGRLHRIYVNHPDDTWLQYLRLARTMAKADSRFVEWMDANPAGQCYAPVQAKMRTRVAKHAFLMRAFAQFVIHGDADNAIMEWNLGADQYRNTFRWWDHLLVLC
jgi:hypothetical protein